MFANIKNVHSILQMSVPFGGAVPYARQVLSPWNSLSPSDGRRPRLAPVTSAYKG